MIKKIKNEKGRGPNKILITLLTFVLAMTAVVLLNLKYLKPTEVTDDYGDVNTKTMSYNEFVTELELGNVEKATYSRYESTFLFYLSGDETTYRTSNPDKDDFKEKLLLAGVDVGDITYARSTTSSSYRFSNFVNRVIRSSIPAFVISFLVFVLLTILESQILFPKKKTEKVRNVRFKDVIGVDEIKKDLLFLVSLAKNNSKKNVRFPRGILLEGPPGNGKTMIAQAIATEADVNFVAINASDMTNKYIGETGRSIRKVFEKAKKNAPCVLFIDEIDAIGSKRSEDVFGAVDKEFNGVINTLLTQIDGITDSEGVIVIAATNMASSLDPALVRPGRFDKHFYIPNPDSQARAELFSHYLIDPDKSKYDYNKLVSMSCGCSCSEIESIVNEAKLIALKENDALPGDNDIITAIRQSKLKGFIKSNNTWSERDKHTVSVHEAGHAVVGHFLAKQIINEISICPTTSGAGGYTMTEPQSEGNMMYFDEVLGNIVMALGGKAAEYVLSGSEEKISLGSSNDIAEATKLAASFVKFKSGIDYHIFRELGASELMDQSKAILDEAYKKAVDTVTEFKDKVTIVAEELEREETITRERFLKLVGDVDKSE